MHNAAMNRQEDKTTRNINNKNNPQKKNRLGTVSKSFLSYFSAKTYVVDTQKNQNICSFDG